MDVDGSVGVDQLVPSRGYNLDPETKVKDPRLRPLYFDYRVDYIVHCRRSSEAKLYYKLE